MAQRAAAKRELINTGTDKRYVAVTKRGDSRSQTTSVAP